MPVGMPSVGHYHPFPEISANIQEIATLSEILDPAHNSHSQIWSSASVGQSCVHSWLSVWIAITAHDSPSHGGHHSLTPSPYHGWCHLSLCTHSPSLQ